MWAGRLPPLRNSPWLQLEPAITDDGHRITVCHVITCQQPLLHYIKEERRGSQILTHNECFQLFTFGQKNVSIPRKIDVFNRKVFTTKKTNYSNGHECILSSQSNQNLGGMKMLKPRNKLRKDVSEKIFMKALLIWIKLVLWELSFWKVFFTPMKSWRRINFSNESGRWGFAQRYSAGWNFCLTIRSKCRI